MEQSIAMTLRELGGIRAGTWVDKRRKEGQLAGAHTPLLLTTN